MRHNTKLVGVLYLVIAELAGGGIVTTPRSRLIYVLVLDVRILLLGSDRLLKACPCIDAARATNGPIHPEFLPVHQGHLAEDPLVGFCEPFTRLRLPLLERLERVDPVLHAPAEVLVVHLFDGHKSGHDMGHFIGDHTKHT